MTIGNEIIEYPEREDDFEAIAEVEAKLIRAGLL